MTQKEAVYTRLCVKPITSMYAFEQMGITRLAAIIHRLRKEGHHIISKDKVTVTRYGRKVHYSEYALVGKES